VSTVPREARPVGTFTLALRPLEFFFAQYRRVWRGTVISSIVTPVVYLLALGVGLGKFVTQELVYGGQAYDYLDVVAPGLLAATAMQVGSFESSWPVLSAIKWSRQYHAMLSAPLRVRDVVFGHQSFIAVRVFTTVAAYLVVLAAFGALESPLAILAIPAAGLVGMAFASSIAAWAAYTESDASFVAIFRFGIVPMFLFSGTFFPVTKMPEVFQALAYATPLWHGVDLCRQLTLGHVIWASALAHVVFLVAWIVGAMTLATITYRRRLVL
jgi:lipooligosaccharide transport system permease protein